MNLLSPWGLAWLATVPALVWLWRLAATSHQLKVSSLIPFEHLLRRPPVRRSRLLVNRLFWLQLAALLLAALALAQPVRWAARSRTTLVIVDTSASMGAGPGLAGAFERARRLLRARLARKSRQEAWFLVSTAPIATLTPHPTADAAELRRALDAVSPSDLPGNLATAVHVGQALLKTPADRILVVTDEPMPPRLADGFEVLSVGQPLANAAVVGLDAQGSLCGQDTVRLLATAQNFSATAQQARLSATQDGRALSQTPLSLAAHAREQVPVALPADAQGWVEVALAAPQDALAVDNRLHAFLRPSASLPVAVLSDEPAFQQAIGRWLSACEGLSWAAELPPAPDQPYLLVTDREEVPARRPVGIVRFQRRAAASPSALAWMVETGHPIAAYLPPLETVAASLGSLGDAAGFGEPVIWGVQEGRRVPLLLAGEQDGQRVVTMAVDPAGSADAVPLVVTFFNSLRWLMGSAEMGRVGEPLAVASLPPGQVSVQRPDGQVERLAHEGGIFRYAATTRAGRYRIAQGGVTVTRAANFLDPVESNLLERASTWRPDLAAASAASAAARVPQPLMDLLLYLVLALLLCEWWLYNRRARSTVTQFRVQGSPAPVGPGGLRAVAQNPQPPAQNEALLR
ncbi:MAG: VWA domain-containing protein [Candidatus Omnitrophica bacterium]|nr:VWA domain-containing protein [Candidatus Omnitrophota bacterium]